MVTEIDRIMRRKILKEVMRLHTNTHTLIYILSHVPRLCGSVTNNSTTRVRIGYRIYSLWRFITTQITIIETTIALA
jgi:hypothetical protein